MPEDLKNMPIDEEAAETVMEDAVQDATMNEAEFDAPIDSYDPTESIEVPSHNVDVAFAPTPTEPLEPTPTEPLASTTEAIPPTVESTTPMENPFPEPQATASFEQPVSTMSGFDVPVTAEAPEMTPPATPVPPADPYASAVASAAAGIPMAQAIPQPAPQPAEPWRQSSQQQYGRPTYADPDFRQNAYQNAVQHQSFAPDPQINPYEQSMTQLPGSMKFGWLCIGLLLGIPGMILAWLVNADKHEQVKHDAILWSVIGFAIAFVFSIIASVALAGLLVAAIDGIASYGMSGYGF